MSESLSRLLAPLETGWFLDHYLNRKHFFISRQDPVFYEDLLTAEDLDRYLQSEHLPSAFVDVVKESRKYPVDEWSRMAAAATGEARVAVPEKLFALYLEGATLILNSINRSVPSLNVLCRSLAIDLGFPVHANVYISPQGATGFRKHTDKHEVMVLQIAGNKRWLVYPASADSVELDLRPGDLLYLPRGVAHAPTTQDSDSIHVTLALTPQYGFDLLRTLAGVAEEDITFQQPAPPRLADESAKQAFESAFLEHLQDLVRQTRPSALSALDLQSLSEKQAKGWAGRLSDLRTFRAMTPCTVVCRRPGILALVGSEGNFRKVEFADKSVIVPAFLETALAKILGRTPFAIGEMEGFMAPDGKVKLVGEFVRAGLLQIVSI